VIYDVDVFNIENAAHSANKSSVRLAGLAMFLGAVGCLMYAMVDFVIW
jgi:hypothetical protein